jgi:hypothetical protein
MCGGGSNQTSTSTTRLPAWLEERYKGLLERGEEVADLPYVAYGGPRLAPFSADQEAAFQGIRDASGIYGADLDRAREYAGIAAAPMADTVGSFDRAAYDRYADPFNQAVIDATIADIGRTGELARRDLDARAGVGGGIGSYGPSERATLERSEQWRDQSDATARAVAQLRSQNFAQAQGQFNTEQNRALAARQNDAARAAAAAGQYVGIGGAGQDYALRDAGARYGIGATQQGQAQRGLDIGYADFLEQRGYPAQQTEFLSGIYRGYPGGPGTRTETVPGANPWAQALGLGIAGIGALGSSRLFKRGGVVRRPISMRNVRRIARKEVARHNRDPRAHQNMRDGGIVGYQVGGQVYGGMSLSDLGRLVDQGDMDAYDEYVRRLTTGAGDVTPADERGGAFARGDREPLPADTRRMTLADMGISSAPGLKLPGGGSEDGPRRLALSDLGIDLGNLQFKVPDWVPGWGGEPERAPVSAHDPGIDDSTVPMMGPRYDPRARARSTAGRGIAAPAKPAINMEQDESGIYSPSMATRGGIDAGIAAPRYSPSMATRGGIADAFTDDDMQSLAKQVGGANADEDAGDAPAWSMPLIAMGLSMAASRNPSVLGALGEGGIAALSSYIDQKRADTKSALEAEKIAREIARDDETARHNVATEETAAANAAGLAAYRQSRAEYGDRRTKAYEDRIKALNARGGAGGGSATERIVANIMAEAKQAGKPMTYAQAVRLAHGANLNDRHSVDLGARRVLAKYDALSGGVAEESDPLSLGEGEDVLGLFAEE